MAYVDMLVSIRAQIAANLQAAIDKPRPSYSLDGRSVDWNTWQSSQLDQMEKLTKKIQELSTRIKQIRQSL